MEDIEETISSSSPPNDTILAPIVTTAAQSSKIFPAELLWHQFVNSMATRQRTCKYPNPEVPEFYPRSMKIVCAEVSHETGDSADETRPASDALQHQNVDILNITRVSQQCLRVQPSFAEAPATALRGVAQYYWTFHNPALLAGFDGHLKRFPRTMQFNLDTGVRKSQLSTVSADRESPGERETSSKSFQDLQIELDTKNQQLVHMNNVVKALLEEIYKINELSMRNRINEQGTYDIHSLIERYLASVGELGYPCDDCCTRLNEFVAHVFKQIERKIVKQHGQYRSSFVDSILSVIENSLHTINHRSQIDEETMKRLRKQDAYTQTSGSRESSPRVDLRTKGKQQMTRVYRNRNLYSYDIAKAAPDSSWYLNGATSRGNRVRPQNASSMFARRRRASTATRRTPTPAFDAENWKNPVQLVHQRFKNLNCRLEGYPERRLVKFSYIVDNKEYSAIATTKKEAQYLCAWHMLDSCKE